MKQIELENAGWGLRIWRAALRKTLRKSFRQVFDDPFDKVRVGVGYRNHLLHAIGKIAGRQGRLLFMLQPFEITSRMQRLEEEFGAAPEALCGKMG